jgi:segregation and condensation protein B
MELKFILEGVLFSAQKPLSIKEIRDVFAAAPEHAEGDPGVKALRKVKEDEVLAALETLQGEHETAGRSYRLACVAGSWQFVTRPEYGPWLKALVGHKARPPRLSQPALETLAIIAYRQPVTRAEVEQVRGVAVDGVVSTLLERGLIEQAGRAEVIGRPMTYVTTPVFLEYFGLRRLEELPAAEELRRIPVQKPAALATVDPGLATAPPGELTQPAIGEAPPAEAPQEAQAAAAAQAGEQPAVAERASEAAAESAGEVIETAGQAAQTTGAAAETLSESAGTDDSDVQTPSEPNKQPE